jgi:hypothetical protein
MWSDLEQALPGATPQGEILDVETVQLSDPSRIAELAAQPELIVGLVGVADDPFGLAISTAPGQAVVIPMDAATPVLDALTSGSTAAIGHDLKTFTPPSPPQPPA